MNNHFFQSCPLLKVFLVIQKYLYQVEQHLSIVGFKGTPMKHNFQIIWIKYGAENNNDSPPKHECKSTGVINKIESLKQERIRDSK